MSLIDSTYFRAELLIAGLSNTIDGNATRLTSFINKYEARYLKDLLGDDLYAEFISGITVDPIDAKWIDLQNKIVNSTTKESPIANYVYYYFQRDATTSTVGVGESNQISENANSASSVDKQIRAWNEMVDYNRKLVKFIQENKADYPSYDNYFYYYSELFIYKNSIGF